MIFTNLKRAMTLYTICFGYYEYNEHNLFSLCLNYLNSCKIISQITFKVQFHGKMKVNIFRHLGPKLLQKRPLLSILHVTSFNPLFQPFKIRKNQKQITETDNFITSSYFIKNWGCYSKIENAKSLGVLMLNKSVTSKF